jgi:glucosamine kinase
MHKFLDDPVSVGSYYLGVDGGGSKTLAVVVDDQGKERGRGLAGSSNYQVIGLEQAVHTIHEAVEQAITEARLHLPLRKAWLGLAGVDRPGDQKKLLPQCQNLAEFVHVTNDADLILGALEQNVGVALIAGTGSIALGRDGSGKTVRAGGWGYLIGDEGSGYAIGCRGIQAAVRAADGRGPQTMLLDTILQHWQLQKAEDIIGHVYADGAKARIAQLATYVFQATKHGDTVACEIVQQAANELALAVNAVATQLTFPQQQVPLALGGGLLLNETDFNSLVLQCVRHRITLGQIVHNEQPALSAARSLI